MPGWWPSIYKLTQVPRRPFIASREFWLGVGSTLLVLALIVGAVSTILAQLG